MSSIVGINAGFGGTGPYRITSPTVEADATAGAVQVNANSKFSTNLPVGLAMLVTDIEWICTQVDAPNVPTGAGQWNWQYIGQLTEALARTVVAQSDPVDIDIYLDEVCYQDQAVTGAGEIFFATNRQKALERHHLWRPWLSVGQQLNLILSVVPGETTTNGPEVTMFTRIYFDLVAVTGAQQAYLAQRIQISGQA